MASFDAAVRHTWRERAACLRSRGVTFYPETDEEVAAAKRICSGCAVRQECLETALRNQERFGVWGGLGPRERSRLARSVRAA